MDMMTLVYSHKDKLASTQRNETEEIHKVKEEQDK